MPTPRERWFADVLRAGLETRVLNEQDILKHATPAVLTAAMPRDVMVRVIEATLASGTMSHKAIIDVVSLDLLGEKASPQVWKCIEETSERAGICDGIPEDETSSREFIRRCLAAGLSTGAFAPKDIVAEVNAKVLGTSLPEALTTKLIEATLASGKMNPEIIVETLGVEAIAKHVSTKVVWSVFAKVGAAQPAVAPAPTSKRPAVAQLPLDRPSLDIIDDQVLVELDADDPLPEPKAKVVPEAKPLPAKQPTRQN